MSGLRPFKIETPRLAIRRFLLGEVDNYLHIRNDPSSSHACPWITPLCPEDAWAFMTRQVVVSPGAPNVEAHLAITDRQQGYVLGTCFVKIDVSGHAEVGLLLATQVRRYDIELEVVNALLKWTKQARDGPRCKEVTLKVNARDDTMLAAYSSAGFNMVSQHLWQGSFPYYVVSA
ncbi:hypothetical protein DACRYDRAFT_13184 [Dacryopinax primogenitus]|uniref:N-acetyltransferase domain-containing protein n=1 Tax=Dacryopinax primogenitus (strain DJM 731) TaxID=1858805 RepID=M5GFT2_DACPD|nr:uncharacterized protein DACRYDRAFT_13184 [Dacryopinax primogenitus]EJU06567.1 hypothetical protein DACRYDRAFT_13184 [Dacryopinax primogenitus]